MKPIDFEYEKGSGSQIDSNLVADVGDAKSVYWVKALDTRKLRLQTCFK